MAAWQCSGLRLECFNSLLCAYEHRYDEIAVGVCVLAFKPICELTNVRSCDPEGALQWGRAFRTVVNFVPPLKIDQK